MLTQVKPEIKGKGKIIALGEFVGVIWKTEGSSELLCHAALFFFSFLGGELFSCESKRQVNKHKQHCL